MDRASNLTEEIARTAFELFQKNYNWEHPIRSLGVRGCADLFCRSSLVDTDIAYAAQHREVDDAILVLLVMMHNKAIDVAEFSTIS